MGLCLLVQVLVSKSADRQIWIEGFEVIENIITYIQLTFTYYVYIHAGNVKCIIARQRREQTHRLWANCMGKPLLC